MKRDISMYDCTYCGVMAQSRDHIIPHSYLTGASRDHAPLMDRALVVPACSECNGLLSNYWLPEIGLRAAYISRRLARRYKDLLAFPDWTATEVAEVATRMEKSIQASMSLREIIKIRIQFAQTVARMTITPLDIWNSEIDRQQQQQVFDAISLENQYTALKRKQTEATTELSEALLTQVKLEVSQVNNAPVGRSYYGVIVPEVEGKAELFFVVTVRQKTISGSSITARLKKPTRPKASVDGNNSRASILKAIGRVFGKDVPRLTTRPILMRLDGPLGRAEIRNFRTLK